MITTTHINLDDAEPGRAPFVLCFGAYGSTQVAVHARHLETAVELAAEWLADNEPDLFSEPDYEEARDRLFPDHDLTDPDADESEREAIYEDAETDHTPTESGWLLSWEWGVVSGPGGK